MESIFQSISSEILKHLNQREIYNLSQTSKLFNELCVIQLKKIKNWLNRRSSAIFINRGLRNESIIFENNHEGTVSININEIETSSFQGSQVNIDKQIAEDFISRTPIKLKNGDIIIIESGHNKSIYIYIDNKIHNIENMTELSNLLYHFPYNYWSKYLHFLKVRITNETYKEYVNYIEFDTIVGIKYCLSRTKFKKGKTFLEMSYRDK